MPEGKYTGGISKKKWFNSMSWMDISLYFTRVKGYKDRYGDESDSWTRSLKGSSRVAIFRRAKVQHDTRLRGSFVH